MGTVAARMPVWRTGGGVEQPDGARGFVAPVCLPTARPRTWASIMSRPPTRRPSRWRSWSQRDRIVPRTRQLSPSSRFLHRIDHYSSLPGAALLVAAILVVAVGVGFVLRFSSGWLAGFETGTALVTLLMVFVIQHTQSREQSATQRKLDELLRALPDAESGLMLLEEASEDVLRDVEMDQRETKQSAADDAEELTGVRDSGAPGR
jgi:low affinity Fe/Cu permease